MLKVGDTFQMSLRKNAKTFTVAHIFETDEKIICPVEIRGRIVVTLDNCRQLQFSKQQDVLVISKKPRHRSEKPRRF